MLVSRILSPLFAMLPSALLVASPLLLANSGEQTPITCPVTCEVEAECCAPKSFCVEGRNRVQGDFLYWKVDYYGLEWAEKVNTDVYTPTFSRFYTDPRLKTIKLGCNPGWRIGFYRTINSDKWELGALWTHLKADGHEILKFAEFNPMLPLGTNVQGLGEDLMDIWTLFPSKPPAEMHGHMDFDYNLIDLVLDKQLLVSKKLLMLPIVGLRGTFIEQKLKIRTTGQTDAEVYLNALVESKQKIRNNFKGLGVLVGFDSDWSIRDYISLILKSGLSLSYGEFDLRQNQTLSALPATPFNLSLSSKPSKRHGLLPSLDLALGAKTGWYSKCYALDLSLLWELNYWFNFIRQNHFDNEIFSSSTKTAHVFQRQGDLMLQGLTVSAAFRF